MNAVNDPEPPKTKLSLLECASLSMALELHPQRVSEVYAEFGLDDAQGTEEVARWKLWLDGRPKEKAEHAQMRARMRERWARWEPSSKRAVVSAPSVPASSPASRDTRLDVRGYATLMAKLEYATVEEAVAILREFGFDEASGRAELEVWKLRLETRPLERSRYFQLRRDLALAGAVEPQRPSGLRALIAPITLEAYAGLCVEFEIDPTHAEAILKAHGLVDLEARAAADTYWRTRLAANEEERRAFDELRADYRTKRRGERTLPASADDLDALPAMALSEPAPTNSPNARPPSSAQPVVASQPIPIASRAASTLNVASVQNDALFEYAALCVELEINPSRADATYERLGIGGEAQRRLVHEVWRGRFAREPSTKAAWEAHVARIRKARGVA